MIQEQAKAKIQICFILAGGATCLTGLFLGYYAASWLIPIGGILICTAFLIEAITEK